MTAKAARTSPATRRSKPRDNGAAGPTVAETSKPRLVPRPNARGVVEWVEATESTLAIWSTPDTAPQSTQGPPSAPETAGHPEVANKTEASLPPIPGFARPTWQHLAVRHPEHHHAPEPQASLQADSTGLAPGDHPAVPGLARPTWQHQAVRHTEHHHQAHAHAHEPQASQPPAKATPSGPKGAIQQRRKEFFALRLKVRCGNATAAQLARLATVAETYGKGELHLTTRQGIEIPWIRKEDLEKALEEAEKAGIGPGASGPRVRVVTACPGNQVCKHGRVDTRELGEELDRLFFGTEVPHKFKIGISGCPNSCTKPLENDLGFSGMAWPIVASGRCIECGKCQATCKEGAIAIAGGTPVIDRQRCLSCGDCIRACPAGAINSRKTGFRISVGGKMGRHPRLGDVIEEFASKERAIELARRALAVYRHYGKPKERFGDTIDRVGFARIKKELTGGDSSR